MVKQEGRKNARRIGDEVERDTVSFFEEQGYLAFRVPNPKRRNGAKFQQKGVYATWDVLVVQKAIIIQCKRRRKYMIHRDKVRLVSSVKVFPKSELSTELVYRDNGLKRETIE